MAIPDKDPIAQLRLPPGFRFYPTDEELLVQYLCRKVAGHHFSLELIAEIDLYKFDPWVLPSKAMFGEKEWYFFSPRDRKYPNGSRPNRVAGSGYWKATGTDKLIMSQGKKVGIKKALVFYIGKAPKGTKTNWIMHEYRLSDSPRKSGSSKLDDWVLCRIYKKSSSADKSIASSSSKELSASGSSPSTSSSHLDDVLDFLPEINDRCFALPRMNSLRANQPQSQQQDVLGLQSFGSGSIDWSVLAGLTSVGHDFGPIGLNQHHHVNNGGDVCVPSLPPLCQVDSPEEKLGNRLEEEVQSGLRNQRVNGLIGGFYNQNPNMMLGQSYSNQPDPFGIRYMDPSPIPGFGFRQHNGSG